MKTPIILALLIMLLASCAPAATPAPTGTALPPSATFTPIPATVTPTFTPGFTPPPPTPLPPTPTFPPMITPNAVQVERWKEYQTELAKSLIPETSYESLLCEWDILGRFDQGVYVWAICGNSQAGGENPAVIHLEMDGSIKYVESPGHGSAVQANIQKMFPKDVQEKFEFNSGRANEMGKHLIYRLTHPEELPLIVLNATPVP